MGCFTRVPWPAELALGMARGLDNKARGVSCVSLGPSILAACLAMPVYIFPPSTLADDHSVSPASTSLALPAPSTGLSSSRIAALPAVADTEVQAHDILCMLTTCSHPRVLF